MTPEELEKNNQGQHLLGRRFHKAAGLTGKIFMDRILLPTANRPNPLLIVSSKFISLANQCGLLNVDASSLDLDYCVDLFDPPPDDLYWRYDFDDGSNVLGDHPQAVLASCQKANRAPATVTEGLAIVREHRGALVHHWVELPGTTHYISDTPALVIHKGTTFLTSLDRRKGTPQVKFGSATFAAQ